jgi:hypothetical protein
VLGRTSYNRVVEDKTFQAAFKSLWLEWTWVYVGCGDGLDDPNLGRLLEWGKQWGYGALDDYFLAKEDKATALNNRPDKPNNLVCVGYHDYHHLPEILRGITPLARCSPFVRVDHDFALFRPPGTATSIPFPSWQEYFNGDVPQLVADTEINQRLEKYGWAFVLDVASVGKTTLALRIATRPEQRNYPVFYLDLAKIDIANGDMLSMALRRLSRPKFLLIVDNVNYQPELARQLWDEWRDNPRESKLLLIGTRTQRLVIMSPAQDLAYFENHPVNPAVELRPTPQDLKHILQSVYRRVAGSSATVVLDPPETVLLDWYQRYGHALGAFCIAILSRLGEFRRGNWALPPEAAADWVSEKWLKPLNQGNRENLICIAVFAAQELEIAVLNKALPCPDQTEQLLELGLVVRTEAGLLGQYRLFSLREPDWGQLVLSAQKTPISEESVLFETAARSTFLVLLLSRRVLPQLEVENRVW